MRTILFFLLILVSAFPIKADDTRKQPRIGAGPCQWITFEREIGPTVVLPQQYRLIVAERFSNTTIVAKKLHGISNQVVLDTKRPWVEEMVAIEETGLVAISRNDGQIEIRAFKVKNEEPLAIIKTSASDIVRMAASGRKIGFSSGKGDTFGVVDTTLKKVLWEKTGLEKGTAHDVAFSSDGSQLMTSGAGIRVYNSVDGRELKVVGHDRQFGVLSVSPTGKMLIASVLEKSEDDFDDDAVSIFSLPSLKQMYLRRGHDGHILDFAFSSDGRVAFSAGYDRSIRMWDTKTGKGWRIPFAHDGTIGRLHSYRVEQVKEEYLVSTGVSDRQVKVWEISKLLAPLKTDP